MSSAAALILCIGAISPAPCASSPEAAPVFAAHYAMSFLSLPVGQAELTANLTAERYALKLEGGLTGLAGWFFQGSGSAGSQGRLSAARTVPDVFRIDSRYGTMPVLVRVTFESGTVRKAEVEPEPAPKPDRVPVTAADRVGVTDPIGMLIIPIGPAPLTPSLCDRRIPVFDGATRADLVLSRGAVVAVATGPYRGPALDCRIRWVPVAGHRAKGSSVRRMAENDDLHVRLAPVPGGRVMLPLSITVGTGWGTARIDATRWGPAPAADPSISGD
ncbi:DUF3108 domain-containing protein [Methylobacterium sp. J-030]|uniref:DUF3108 domain-containing protein n=1 Tax=Methylobacterium sp. J-030 TaxID=2836627 RepID=UPI00391CFD9D